MIHRPAVAHHKAMNQSEPNYNDIQTVTFKPGEILFHENELSFHFFIIQAGEVEILKAGHEGTVVLATVGVGGSLGEFAMLDRKPRSASARAVTVVTAARVSPEAYDQLLNDLPDWAVSVMRALVERLRFTNEIVKTLQRSKTGVLAQSDRQALQSAEFDSENRIARIQEAEQSVESDSTNFDFSIYESTDDPPTKSSTQK